MKKYIGDYLGYLGIVMAVYAGLWTVLCDKTGLISVAGFAGCTTYFACGKKKWQGMATAAASNLSGVFWAMMSIWLGSLISFPYAGAVFCAVISYFIIKQAELDWFKFIPGAYIGCFMTFACDGQWKKVVLSILIGIGMGYLTEWTTGLIYKKPIEN